MAKMAENEEKRHRETWFQSNDASLYRDSEGHLCP